MSAAYARGQLWRMAPILAGRPTPAGATDLRLIVSANAINRDPDTSVVLALALVDDDPGSLLSVRIGEHGWARALTIGRVPKSRLTEQVGTAGVEALDQVDAALRAVQEL